MAHVHSHVCVCVCVRACVCVCVCVCMGLLRREAGLRRHDGLGAVISSVELHARRFDEARPPAELEVEIVEIVEVVAVVAAAAETQIDIQYRVVGGPLVQARPPGLALRHLRHRVSLGLGLGLGLGLVLLSLIHI